MAQPLRKLGAAFRFDGRNTYAQALAAQQAAQYVTRVSEETRQAINTLIVKSIRDGVTTYETSRLIRSIVGLTSPSAAAVSNYYQNLVRQGTNQVRAQALADKYAQKLLRVRAITIARTEIMGALNAGALEQARQRAAAGMLRDPHKRWTITPDEATCAICRPLHGQTVPLESRFSIGVMAPPAHPNCRCSISFLEGTAAAKKTPPAAIPPADARWNLQGAARQAYAKWLLANRRRK